MKRLFFILIILFSYCSMQAAEAAKPRPKMEFETILYIDSTAVGQAPATRGAFSDAVKSAGVAALSGSVTGVVSALVSFGVDALTYVITIRKRMRKNWEETIQKENAFTTKFSTVTQINDFYNKPSQRGALDPQGMQFNGIACRQIAVEDGVRDTSLFLAVHLDPDKKENIWNHSKFNLVVDTLRFNPFASNLPNTTLSINYDFKERPRLAVDFTIRIFASWYAENLTLHQNQQLGTFNIHVDIDSTSLEKGRYNYVRSEILDAKAEAEAYDEPYTGLPLIACAGESFIVPRSYMPCEEGSALHNQWGTGEYKIEIEMNETCEISDQMKQEWIKDYRRHRKLAKEMGVPVDNPWNYFVTQRWDETSQEMVTTITKEATTPLINSFGKAINATLTK